MRRRLVKRPSVRPPSRRARSSSTSAVSRTRSAPPRERDHAHVVGVIERARHGDARAGARARAPRSSRSPSAAKRVAAHEQARGDAREREQARRAARGRSPRRARRAAPRGASGRRAARRPRRRRPRRGRPLRRRDRARATRRAGPRARAPARACAASSAGTRVDQLVDARRGGGAPSARRPRGACSVVPGSCTSPNSPASGPSARPSATRSFRERRGARHERRVRAAAAPLPRAAPRPRAPARGRRAPEDLVDALEHLLRPHREGVHLVGDVGQLVHLVHDRVLEGGVVGRPAQQKIVVRDHEVRVVRARRGAGRAGSRAPSRTGRACTARRAPPPSDAGDRAAARSGGAARPAPSRSRRASASARTLRARRTRCDPPGRGAANGPRRAPRRAGARRRSSRGP